MMSAAALLLVSASVAAAEPPLTLWLLPHTHADVGWLQTVNSLARVNVSRILSGVVATLDTSPSRRFVWDEMAFLQHWWENDATESERSKFKHFVQARRIEMVDNGWSQHDMGSTTLDSMLNNWVEGHEWIRANLGAEYEPRIGWSLDPFGMSSSQAVLQALQGMDAWFFTRLSGSEVDARKAAKSLEFVWRASSSLPNETSEIFCHVYESYYCMPSDFQFEWSASFPNATTLLPLARKLAALAVNRSKWFRTRHVLIPWGCDYMYQDANLTFSGTDLLIDAVNARTSEWGVTVRYGTASEYVDAVHQAAHAAPPAEPRAPRPSGRREHRGEGSAAAEVRFPIAEAGTSFFPYEDWSGYFTSRPLLKQLSRQAHGALYAAEQSFVKSGRKVSSGERAALWARLEQARRNAAIFQHHDAITGTFCAASEGCPGEDQDIGSHDVLGSYETMLRGAIEMSNRVYTELEAVELAEEGFHGGEPSGRAPALSVDPAFLGDLLMGEGTGGGSGLVHVRNPLAQTVTEAINIPVPVCAVTVRDAATGRTIDSQTTANLGISDRLPPFYDFSVSFVARIEPMAIRSFVVETVEFARRSCLRSSRADFPTARATATRHRPVGSNGAYADDQGHDDDHNSGNGRDHRDKEDAPPPPPLDLENNYLRVSWDARFGLTGVLDKQSGRHFPLRHRLYEYEMASTNLQGAGPAYSMQVMGDAKPLLSTTRYAAGELVCRAWRATIGGEADGSRNASLDQSCATLVGWPNASGYCECAQSFGINDEKRVKLHPLDADPTSWRKPITCAAVCAGGGNVTNGAIHATVALGPVMHEVRLQVTPEHTTRVRLWQTDDPTLGQRIEVGVGVGVLQPLSELISRFTFVDDGGSAQLVSEDNGYELIPRAAAPRDAPVGRHVYPSQQSAYLVVSNMTDATASTAGIAPNHGQGGPEVMMSVVLDRAVGVAQVEAGSLDVMQHRRSLPFRGSIWGHTPVVLDDTDRLYSTSWLSIGERTAANRLRHANKHRHFSPPLVSFGSTRALTRQSRPTATTLLKGRRPSLVDLPPSIHLQSVRAVDPNASAFLVRLQHLYAKDEDAERSTEQNVDLRALLSALVPDATQISAEEMTLDGARPITAMAQRRRMPTEDGQHINHHMSSASDTNVLHPIVAPANVTLHPMQLRTWRVTLSGP